MGAMFSQADVDDENDIVEDPDYIAASRDLEQSSSRAVDTNFQNPTSTRESSIQDDFDLINKISHEVKSQDEDAEEDQDPDNRTASENLKQSSIVSFAINYERNRLMQIQNLQLTREQINSIQVDLGLQDKGYVPLTAHDAHGRPRATFKRST